MTDWDGLQRIVDAAFEKPEVHPHHSVRLTTDFDTANDHIVIITSEQVPGHKIVWNRDTKGMLHKQDGMKDIKILEPQDTYAKAHYEARKFFEKVLKDYDTKPIE